MKTQTINNMLSAIVMLAMDVTTIDQVASTHFEVLALKILNSKI